MRAEYCTSGARVRRKLACSASSVSGRSARAYGCHARSPRMPRTVLRSSCNCRAISDFDRLSALAPAVLPNHASLPEWCDLGASVGGGRRRARQQCLRHDDALLREEGGEFSMTTSGDYWVTADNPSKQESSE